jgi:hypothetical protein
MSLIDVAVRALRRLPLLRAYPALLDAREEIRQLRARTKALEADLDRARQIAAQRELALRSAGASSSQALAAGAFDPQRLSEIARRHGEAYRRAAPFPHLVHDGLFDPAYLDQVLAEFESMDRGGWRRSEGRHERKWSTEDVLRMGPFTSALIAQLNSSNFIGFLEELSGIAGLVPDPHLRGGGLHEIRPGGMLGVHADFNLHTRLKLYRRLNLLVYLNKGWMDEWGGALELWDRTAWQPLKAIPPVFNRAVIFDTSNRSYHGHPHPLACPEGRSRKSVALYYYTAECAPGDDVTPHGTLFVGDGTATTATAAMH